MASKSDTSIAGRSDPSTISAAALRLDPLLRKIRDGLSQYLEAFALAIHGARREDIKWPLFMVVVPDPGDGGTIDVVQQEAGDFVGIDSFGICSFNIPVSEADIETAASYLRHCALDPDAQRLLEVFKGLKAAFCSVVDFIPLPDGLMANRKFYAQDRALMLSEHLEELIRTLPTIVTGGGSGQSREAASGGGAAETATADEGEASKSAGQRLQMPDLSPVQDAIYRALTAEFQPARDIATVAKCDERHAYRELANLGRMGLAENKRGKGYRRKS